MPCIRSTLSLLLAVLLCSPGCTTMDDVSADTSRTMKSLRTNAGDYADPTDQSSDPWIQQAGAEARGHRPREESVEPEWFTNMLRSPKAREIENNLGFD